MKKGDFSSNKRGFTIIEVTLVIAIAGLIFLMVFVALPGLRASQRDAERREDVTMFLENIKKYQTNNRGALPGSAENSKLDNGNVITVTISNANGATKDTTWAGFYKKYLGDKFIDPDGDNYTLKVVRCGNDTPDAECTNGNTAGAGELRGLYDVTFPNDYKVYVVTQASCLGDKAVKTSNPRKLAVLYKLEGAGIYCNNT